MANAIRSKNDFIPRNPISDDCTNLTGATSQTATRTARGVAVSNAKNEGNPEVLVDGESKSAECVVVDVRGW
jgi:hypothetical protein